MASSDGDGVGAFGEDRGGTPVRSRSLPSGSTASSTQGRILRPRPEPESAAAGLSRSSTSLGRRPPSALVLTWDDAQQRLPRGSSRLVLNDYELLLLGLRELRRLSGEMRLVQPSAHSVHPSSWLPGMRTVDPARLVRAWLPSVRDVLWNSWRNTPAVHRPGLDTHRIQLNCVIRRIHELSFILQYGSGIPPLRRVSVDQYLSLLPASGVFMSAPVHSLREIIPVHVGVSRRDNSRLTASALEWIGLSLPLVVLARLFLQVLGSASGVGQSRKSQGSKVSRVKVASLKGQWSQGSRLKVKVLRVKAEVSIVNGLKGQG
jgi:hypothetical protein